MYSYYLVTIQLLLCISYSVCFNDPQNVSVVNRLIKEVSASNPSFQAGLIRCKLGIVMMLVLLLFVCFGELLSRV